MNLFLLTFNISKMIKRILCGLITFLIFFTTGALSQSGNCPKIRVGVKIEEVYTEVFDHLNKDYSTDKHRAVWLAELGEKLMESLRNNSPEIEFIYLPASPDTDYDYLFKTLIALIGGGANIEVAPEQTIIEGDNVLTVPPLYRSEYINYLVLSSLIVNSNCYPSRRYILKIEKYQNRDINLAITGNVVQFWRLINIIEARENERPVPPREPGVETRLEKEYLSPLFEETRKMKIYEKVISCNGVPAYFTHDHSQPVKFPDKTDRGDIKPADNCKCYISGGGVQYILVNESGEAVGEYTLKRGVYPLLEKITLTTCPLGNKPPIEREVEIKIRGLEITVESYKKVIDVGEQTRIAIDLHEIDPDGFKYPAIRQEVEIKVTGLVDGSVYPIGKVTVDDMGVAWLDYKAGQQDKQIKITAIFTPPGYPETVMGEATITVRKEEGDFNGTIMYQRQVHWKDESRSTYSNVSVTVDLVENASINVAAKYLRTISNSTGVYELFGTESLSGNFSVTMKKVSVITDHQGNWTKIVDTWQGDEMLDPETAGNILLTIEPKKKKYTLQPQLYFPSFDGQTVTTTSEGGHMVTDPGSWACNASFEFEGYTDGNSVNDSWSEPAIGNIAVSPQSGLISGATWNWSMSRAKKKNK